MAKKKPDDFVPQKDFPKSHHHHGKARCQKWSYRNERQCMALAMRGKDCCRVHGGKSLSGLASPTLKTGKHSKEIAARIVEIYEDALVDPELLALREDIAILNARRVDLMRRTDKGETAGLWEALQSEHVLMQAAARRDDKEGANRHNQEIQRLIVRGYADYKDWEEIYKVTELIRRLKESERKRLVDMQVMISVEHFIHIIKQASLVINEEVESANERQRINDRLGRILRGTVS